MYLFNLQASAKHCAAACNAVVDVRACVKVELYRVLFGKKTVMATLIIWIIRSLISGSAQRK